MKAVARLVLDVDASEFFIEMASWTRMSSTEELSELDHVVSVSTHGDCRILALPKSNLIRPFRFTSRCAELTSVVPGASWQ